MINTPSSFIVVKGADATDETPFGDLQRIDLGCGLLAKRLDRRLMGVDAAWLQECAAERNHIRGWNIGNYLETFSVGVRRAPIDSVATSVKSWPMVGKPKTDRWVVTPDIGSGSGVIECEETIGDSGVIETDLSRILDARGLLVKGPTMPIPEMGNDLRGSMVLALERAMRDFVYIVVDCGTTKAFASEDREGDAREDETLVGSRIVYKEYRSYTYDNDAQEWKTDRHYKLTAKIVGLSNLAIDFPRRTYGGRPVAKRVTTWYLVMTHHFRPSSGDVQKWFYVKGTTFNAAPSLTQYDVDAILLAAKRHSFDMGDLTAEELELGQVCYLEITVGGVWCLAEMRDEVVELE